jgi:hypothetical protein
MKEKLKSKLKIAIIMMLFMNMCSMVTLGKVTLNNVTKFEISENIGDISTTAKIIIPQNNYAYKNWDNQKPITEQIVVGDKVVIYAGYDGELQKEFEGYISEIGSESPLVVECEDMYILRQNKITKSYREATLKQVMEDITKDMGVKVECDDVKLGKYIIENLSTYNVLQDLKDNYGLSSRFKDGVLTVGLSHLFGGRFDTYTYYMNQKVEGSKFSGNVKKSNLKYKKKEDFKIRCKATATTADGKKVTIEVGSKDKDASERSLNFAGKMTKQELKQVAEGVMAKYVYDGYTGDVIGFGLPRTHAGGSLTITDNLYPQRGGTYLIEKVEINYDNSSGWQRQNTLAYEVGNNSDN